MAAYSPDYSSPDYELAWPKAIFIAEANALVAYAGLGWSDRATLLLEEAFTGQAPLDEIRTASWPDLPGAINAAWGGATTDGEDAQRRALAVLARDADQMRERTAPKPYWPPGKARSLRAPPVDPFGAGASKGDLLRRDWDAVVTTFESRGYFEGVAPKPCADDSNPPPPSSHVLDAEIAARTGITGLWPLRPATGTRTCSSQ